MYFTSLWDGKGREVDGTTASSCYSQRASYGILQAKSVQPQTTGPGPAV